jgi:sphingomyelin phosphodiesterase acid-like 3
MKSKKSLALFFILALSVTGFGKVFAQEDAALPWNLNDHEGVFLLLSDIHLTPFDDPALVPQLVRAPVEQWQSIFEASSHKAFTSYGADPNYALFKSALAEINHLGVPYDYALVTGDYISHNFIDDFHKRVGGDDRALKDFSTKTILFVTEMVQKSLPGVPVYFAVGNHDSECDSYKMAGDTDLWKALAQSWSTVAADPQAAAEFSQGGYYAVTHPTIANRELVVLNSIFWSDKYAGGCSVEKNSGNPGDEEMTWLQKTLEQAQKSGQTVSLEMHIPPGMNSEKAEKRKGDGKKAKLLWKPQYEDQFIHLAAQYSHILQGNFAGHTHMDDYRLAVDTDGRPFLLTHLTPGLCQIDGNNPGFQVMRYDKTSGELEDLATFYVPDLHTADPAKNPWELEYTFQQAYGYSAYSMANLLDLAGRIDSEPAVRQKYIDFYALKTPAPSPINAENWQAFSCGHTHMDSHSFNDCYR